jgi:hypothetical protein
MGAQETFEIDLNHYSYLLFTLSIALDYEYQSWMTSVDDFVNSTFVFSGGAFHLGFFEPFLHAECVAALQASMLQPDIMAMCQEQMLASPRHQEAGSYVVADC